METGYKKAIEPISLENEEILKEFEMVELKGGASFSSKGNNYSCTNSNCNNKCCSKINEANMLSESRHLKSDY